MLREKFRDSSRRADDRVMGTDSREMTDIG